MMIFRDLQVSGEDACSFLQGQLTVDVLTLKEGERILMACCDRKGRMIVNGFVELRAGSYSLLVEPSLFEILKMRLQKYILRAKVVLEDNGESSLDELDTNWVFLSEKTSELFTPQMLNWQKYGGIHFKKGCYIGQEIVARTEYLGKLKRHLYDVQFECGEMHDIGSTLCDADNTEFGVIVSADKAVIKDQAADAKLDLLCVHQCAVLFSPTK